MTRPAGHSPRRRLLAAAAAAALSAAGWALAAAPASAAACSGTSGVTVVVDTGSSIVTRCAPGDPSSGLEALAAAGFSVEQVQTQPGFVCRINGFPETSCVRTPPADAYWAYWHAPRGGSWSYSQVGAGSYDPKPGTVEGWRFGSGQKPRTAPPAPVRTAAPKPTTAAPRPTTAAPRPTTGAPKPTAAAPRATASPRSGSTATPRPTRTTSSTSPSATGTPTASTAATPSANANGDPTSSATPSEDTTLAARAASGGSGPGPGALVAGGALVALVAAAAGWTAWRRRS